MGGAGIYHIGIGTLEDCLHDFGRAFGGFSEAGMHKIFTLHPQTLNLCFNRRGSIMVGSDFIKSKSHIKAVLYWINVRDPLKGDMGIIDGYSGNNIGFRDPFDTFWGMGFRIFM